MMVNMKAAMQIMKKKLFWRHPVLQYNTIIINIIIIHFYQLDTGGHTQKAQSV